MGSHLEFNDTLQLTTEQGFPTQILDLAKHREHPIVLQDIRDMVFEFHGKPGARVYHPAPTRCFLVQNINGKWLHWGKAIILEQTIKGETTETQTTSGKYRITEIYDPEYQEQTTRREAPIGLSYFE